MNARESIFTAFFFMSLLSTGCGQLYRVTPLPKVPGRAPIATAVNGLEVVVTALDGDLALEQFDANLPMAGVMAVDVDLVNRSPGPIRIESIRYTLVDPGGQTAPKLTPELALRRVMKFYGNRIYQIDAHRETVEAYRKIAVSESGVLETGERINGMLFFEIPGQAPLKKGFSLVVRLEGQSVSLPLDSDQ